jgi:hypothetical protein
MKRFFPMPWGDLAFLVGLVGFAVVAFLPWSRGLMVGNMAALGWLMAALMILSPVVALLRLFLARSSAPPTDEERER